MRKWISKIILAWLPFFVFFGMTISANAMSEEEKELFSMLGVEYRLDDNGNFLEFVVSETTPRCSQEQLQKLVDKYKNKKRIGEYTIQAGINEHTGELVFGLYSESGVEYFATDKTEIYVNADRSYYSMNYQDKNDQEPDTYVKGIRISDENGNYPYEYYVRDEQGNFIPRSKKEGTISYLYDDKGRLEEYLDLSTSIIYDYDGNPTHKKMVLQNDNFYVSKVPIDVADEIQAHLDQKQGKFDEDVVREILNDSYMSDKLGLDLEIYRERNEIYKKYAEQGCVSLEMKVQIFGVERKAFLNEPIPVEEGALPDTISEEAIAEALVNIINEYRVENGLNPLEACNLLQQVADIRGEECTYIMDCSHSRPLIGNVRAFGVGENIACKTMYYDLTSEEIAKAVFEMWKNSEGHNKNMLTEGYQQGAIGITITDTGVYASHVFSSNYEEKVTDEILRMIEIGVQYPSKDGSVAGYYEKLLKEHLKDKANKEVSASNAGYTVITEDEFAAGVMFNTMMIGEMADDEYTRAVLAELNNMMQSYGYVQGSANGMLWRCHPIRFGTDVREAANSLASDMMTILFNGGSFYEIMYVQKVANGYIFEFEVQNGN